MSDLAAKRRAWGPGRRSEGVAVWPQGKCSVGNGGAGVVGVFLGVNLVPELDEIDPDLAAAVLPVHYGSSELHRLGAFGLNDQLSETTDAQTFCIFSCSSLANVV